MKGFLKHYYFLPIQEKRKLIEEQLWDAGYEFQIQDFHKDGYKGKNFVVLDFFEESKPVIIITTHYDGFGAYDNAGGVIALLWLLRWIKLDNLKNLNNKWGLIVVFLDGEERGLIGARNFVENSMLEKVKIRGHISLDGFGIGNLIGGFGNMKSVRIRLGRKGEIEVPLSADTSVFQEKGISSLHIFSLPHNELQNLVHHSIFPPQWHILHTKEDTPENIAEELIPYVVLYLYGRLADLDFKKQGIFIV